jgi:ubiquinone/menaquinone biosynthesis C-methylase UbiE
MTDPSAAPDDFIELLGPALLDSERDTADAVMRLSRSLRISLGWHYLLDVVWTNLEIERSRPSTVLDAGAGVGIMQWFLAERGVNVISIDRLDRSRLSVRYRTRYSVAGLQRDELAPIGRSLLADARTGALFVDAARDARGVVDRMRGGNRSRGRVTLHHSGLGDLAAIADGSVDAVVSISSLEHNEPGDIPQIASELWRVLRPGGTLTATVGAAKADWFHEPSRGWCFSEATIRQLFGLAPSTPSNYDRFDEIMAAVRANEELRTNLARSYFRSGSNGMPWGKWDPTYLSVGIRRHKPE